MIMIVSSTKRLLFARSASRTRAKQVVGRCGLVVAPQGIALIQGKLKGKLRWDEIRNIDVRQTTNSSAADHYTVIHHLQIKLDGTSIIVVDAFRHSLAVVRGAIHAYWKG